jgi:hypothetical protein
MQDMCRMKKWRKRGRPKNDDSCKDAHLSILNYRFLTVTVVSRPTWLNRDIWILLAERTTHICDCCVSNCLNYSSLLCSLRDTCFDVGILFCKVGRGATSFSGSMGLTSLTQGSSFSTRNGELQALGSTSPEPSTNDGRGEEQSRLKAT